MSLSSKHNQDDQISTSSRQKRRAMSFYNKRSYPLAARQEEGKEIESKLNQLLSNNYLFHDPKDTFGATNNEEKVI